MAHSPLAFKRAAPGAVTDVHADIKLSEKALGICAREAASTVLIYAAAIGSGYILGSEQ